MKSLQKVDCECCVQAQFLGFRWRKKSYQQMIAWDSVGKMCIILARPHKGWHLHGWYVLCFGGVLSFTPFRDKA